MKLSRTDLKFAVDTLMFVTILGVVAIGVLMAFFIPEGRLGAGQSKYFLGLHRHQWGDIHLYLSLAFAVFAVIHIVLAWSWVKGKASCIFGKSWKAAVGLTVLAAVLVPAAFWLAAPKNDPAYAEFGTGYGRGAGRTREAALFIPEPPAAVASSGLEVEAADVASQTAGAGTGERARPGETPAAEPGHEDRVVAGRMEASAEVVITGQMTLRELERVAGVPAADIAAKLGLPSDVARDETLGRLRRIYGFEMQALRDAIAELRTAKK